jgi:glycosyltransferase involved in cell wall biosynthesis
MKLLVVDNAHIYKTKEGKYYSTSIYDNSFFKRYLNVFDSVRFCAKVKLVDEVDLKKHKPLDIEGLEIWEIPWYKGMKGLLKKFPQVIKSMKKSYESVDVSLYRVIQVESILSYICRNKKIKYAVEVVNDPKTFKGGMLFFYKWLSYYYLKKIIKNSHGVSYVTQHYLQKRYPPGELPTKSYSSVSIDELDIREPKKYNQKDLMKCIRLIHVSNNISGKSKGHVETLKIISKIINKGYNCEVTFIGSGSFIPKLLKMSKKMNIDNNVNFIGHISSKKILLETLREHDIFIFPSHSEGLPRVVLEAMSCGLPCITSNVGGLPEIIDRKYTIPFRDIETFSERIIELINNYEELNQLSFKNIEMAKEFTSTKLTKKRNCFYNLLR